MTTYHYATPKTHLPLSGFDRVKVDPGQTNFWLGRQFRTFHELNIPTGVFTIRIVVTVPVILTGVQLELDDGHVRLATIAGGTAGGTWAGVVPVLAANNLPVGKDKLEAYAPTLALASGGTVTGGTTIDVIRAKVADNSNFMSSVNAAEDNPRGVAPGTYYFQFTALTAPVTGVFRATWEERP